MNRIVLLGMVLLSVVSQGAMQMAFKGGATMATPKGDVGGVALTYKADNSFGGGLVFGIPLSKVTTFEFGGLYLPRKYKNTVLDIEVVTTVPQIEVPLNLRFKLSRAFSLIAGGYVGMGMGKVKTAALGVTTESTFAENNMATMDYGATGGISIDIPIGKTSELVLEGRYVYGLADLAKDGDVKFNMRAIDALLGLRFEL